MCAGNGNDGSSFYSGEAPGILSIHQQPNNKLENNKDQNKLFFMN